VGAPPNKLSRGWFGHAVVFDVRLCRFPSVMHGVFVVTASSEKLRRRRGDGVDGVYGRNSF